MDKSGVKEFISVGNAKVIGVTGFPYGKDNINLEKKLIESLGFFSYSWGGSETNDLPFSNEFDLPTDISERVKLILKSLISKPGYWVFDEPSFIALKAEK